MSIEIKPIVARVRASNDPRLSPGEVVALEAAAPATLDASGLLGMHYYRAGAYGDAARHGRILFERAPSAESAKSLVSALFMGGQFEEALALCDAAEALLDPATLAETRCEIHARAGRPDQAVAFGRLALELKDAAQPVIGRPEPAVRPFDVERPERNVISFSLFGDGERYRQGALRNAIVARHLYPGWTARFYVDDSLPEPMLKGLIAEGAQIRKVPNLPAARYGLFWRLLVEDDPEVDIYIVRDADSVLNIRERAAVEDWLASGRPYHVMRDHPVHCELILAGMWGAHRGNLGPIGPRILAHVRAAEARLNNRTSDQAFLRETVWPLIRRDALIHDACFGLQGTLPFRPDFALPRAMHVGANDTALRSKPR